MGVQAGCCYASASQNVYTFLVKSCPFYSEAIRRSKKIVSISAELKQHTVKELSSIAKELDISGWHDMRKDDLVRAIAAKRRSLESRSTKSDRISKSGKNVKTTSSSKKQQKQEEIPLPSKRSSQKPRSAAVEQQISELREKLSKSKSISGIYDEINGDNRDRFILLVRDPYWLHAYWELCSRLIDRAKAAMGHAWHTASPILRLFRIVADGMNNPRREHVKDIKIHGGANNWYIDVLDPPGTFQLEIGFISREGNFFPIASSNIVQTPLNQVNETMGKLDGHWGSVSEDFDRIYKLSGGMEGNNQQLKSVFEKQLQRSMSLPVITRFARQNIGGFEKTRRNFEFNVDADVIVYGKADPSVQVSIKGEPIKLANDGTFSVRYSLVEKRQVFPVDAKGSDGIETQQVIIAVERNTKVLETVFLDYEEED